MTTLALVVNPAAGRGRARRLMPRVAARLCDLVPGVGLRVHLASDYSQARDHCMEDVASGVDGLVVVGGDGMAHLGINACANTDVPLGIVPLGTGNDFCRGAGLPARWDSALTAIAGGVTRRIDVMEVTGAVASGASELVGSIVSTGFDELVNHRTNTLPFTIGAPSYAYSVLHELRHFRPLHYRIETDGVARELDAMLIAVGNAGMFGGGMRACPNADITDGELDVTIIHPVGRGTLLRLLPRLFDGSFVKHPCVELLRAREVRIDGDDLWSMADGERLGRVPLDCRAIPGALSVFVPATPQPPRG